MPELPEVETVAGVLRNQLVGAKMTGATILWPKIVGGDQNFFEHIAGRKVLAVGRRGKYLIVDLDQGHLIIHLRMEGKFFISPKGQDPRPHTHVILHFETFDLEYNDIRKFGRILYTEDPKPHLEPKLGPEPFDERLDPSYLRQKARTRSVALKTFLLDQSIIAGIGNIYADEICFSVRLSPYKPVKSLKLKEWAAIIDATRAILGAAIADGGTTIRSYTSSLGVTGRFQQTLNVYGRGGQACRVCGETLHKGTVGQRSTVYCLKCQKVSPHAHRHHGLHGQRKVRSGTHPA